MWFSKRQQGVISVFLLICFTMTFVFSGLLVDGARVRLAKMLAEGSLDTAASSVLSYYDELLFDLYGLFAVDDPDMEKITARMDQYFEQTLALVPGDHTELKKMLNDSVEQAFFDGYDFQVNLTKVGSDLNLGQTSVTQAQIVEHMKYRAPLQLIDSEYGFLNNLQGLLEIKDRLTAVKEKNEVTQKHKSSIESGGPLVDKINQFKDDCEKLLQDPLDRGKSSFAATVNDAIKAYNDSLQEEFNEYCRILREHRRAMDDEDGISESTDRMYRNREDAILVNVGRLGNEFFNNTIVPLEEQINNLFERDKTLKNEVEAYVGRMTTYINELQEKCNSGNQEYKTVFEPEIELSKATVGEVILNKGVLLQALLYLNITSDYSDFYMEIDNAIESKFVAARSAWGSGISWQNMQTKISHHKYISDLLTKMDNLKDACEDFTYAKKETQSATYKPNNLNKVDDLGSADKDEHSSEYKQGMRKIDVSLFEGAVSNPAAAEAVEKFDLSKTYKEDADKAADQTFRNGIDLMENLMNLLEKVRDEIYVDEYILANCRNYVHHYNMEQENDGKEDYEKIIAPKFFEDKYKNHQYMVGEIEYILAGNADQYKNVAFVSGEILLFRTAFNLAAIFSDTSMYQQASTLCAAAGPFAPLATFALMVAWAVAESVIDVMDIMSGKKVLLFKKGKDWNISVRGAVENLVGRVVDGIVDAAYNEAKFYLNQVTEQYNAAIYDYYVNSEALHSGLDSARELAGSVPQANEWINKADNTLNNFDTLVGDTDGLIKYNKDIAITKISESYKSARDSLSSSLGDSFVAPERPNISGTSNDTSLKLGYTDYLRILLLMENSTQKMERLQQIIQLNMLQQDNRSGFKMVNSRVNVWGEATCSIKYLFMTDALVPQDIRLGGRFQFIVKTNRTY